MHLKYLKIALSVFACLLLFVSNSNAQEIADEKSIEVSLRMIGHQILLGSKDSISRVLPIIKNNNQYSIQFESKFEFKPSELVSIFDRVVTETNMASSYIVEVQQCESSEVVYSFKMANLEQSDIIPCGQRIQPLACYTILFTLIPPNKADTTLLPVTSDSTTELNSGINLLNYSSIAAVFVLLSGLLFFLWKRKKASTLDPNLISLGEYHFDKRNTELLINHERIELTSKEADLLLLLYNMVNTTVEREVILNKVWGDQGDYVGRTLDVFISKLRKKLEADSSVKIRNIRGVGYKLVMEV